MTGHETLELMQRIKHFYPRFELATETVKEWVRMFESVDARTANYNLDQYVVNDESGRPPVIAKLLSGRLKSVNVFVDWDKRRELWKTLKEKSRDETYIYYGYDQDGYEWVDFV